jgi:glycosyltransferase involved in cell wall biosynthesis
MYSILDNVTVIIITRNEGDSIDLCLINLRRYFKNIVVVDMESEDDTLKKASKYDVTVLSHPFIEDFDKARNWGIDEAKTDWIYINDADEFISESLVIEVLSFITKGDCDVIEIPRVNLHLGYYMKLLRPEFIPRFFKKNVIDGNYLGKIHTYYTFLGIAKKKACNFYFPNCALFHFSGLFSGSVINKINLYTDFEALNLAHRKRRGLIFIFFVGGRAFFRKFIISGYYKCYYKGFLWSFYDGLYAMLTYIKANELIEWEEVKNLKRREIIMKVIDKYRIPIIDNKI